MNVENANPVLVPPPLPIEQRPSYLPQEGKYWLIITGGLLFTAMFKSINLLLLLSYLMLGLWGVNWLIVWRISKHLQGKRIPISPIFAGKPLNWQVEIEHHESKPAEGWMILDHGPDHQLEWFVVRIDQGQPMRLGHDLVLPNRGRYLCEPLRAWTRFPFGLFQRSIELTSSEERIVLPKIVPIHEQRFRHWLQKSTRGSGRQQQQVRHFSTHEAEVHGLRSFRPGDSPRWIHWRTSARKNELMVREFEDNAPPQLLLILEPWLPQSPNEVNREHLERLLSIAASIILLWCKQPDAPLSLILGSREGKIFRDARGTERAMQLLTELALEPGSATEIPNTSLSNLRQVSSMMILTLSSRSSSDLARRVGTLTGCPAASFEMTDSVPFLTNQNPEPTPEKSLATAIIENTESQTS